MKKTLWIIPLALTLPACSPTVIEPEVSADCTAAMAELEKIPMDDYEAEDTAVTNTAQACPTVSEYITAVKANPAAWAYTDAKKINEEILIMSACSRNTDEPMCIDAKEQGIID